MHGECIIFPYCEGSLDDMIRHRAVAGTDIDLVKTTMKSIFHALGKLHKQRLIHGNVNATNFAVFQDRILLTDLDAVVEVRACVCERANGGGAGV